MEPDYASVAPAAGNALAGLGNFLFNLKQWSVKKPLVQAETTQAQAAAAEANARAAAQTQQTEQQKQLFSLWGLPFAQKRAGLLNGGAGAGAGDAAGADSAAADSPQLPGFSPRLSLGPVSPAVTPPGATPAPGADAPMPLPDMGRVGSGLPPAQPAAQSVTPPAGAPRGGVGVAMTVGKTGEAQFDPGVLGPWKAFYDAHPDEALAAADPKTREALSEYGKGNALALANRKAAAELEPALMTAAYGDAGERKDRTEFSNAAQMGSYIMDRWLDTVEKHGNYQPTSRLLPSNKQAAADLLSYPMNFADVWNKIINPGNAVREGLLGLNKQFVIPSPESLRQAVEIAPDVTKAGIRNTQRLLAEYVRATENQPTTKVPVLNLSPSVRKLVGPTAASTAWEKRTGHPVPTLSGIERDAAVSGAAPAEPSAAPVSTSGIKSQAEFDKFYANLSPGATYYDEHGNIKTKAGPAATGKPGAVRPVPAVTNPAAGTPGEPLTAQHIGAQWEEFARSVAAQKFAKGVKLTASDKALFSPEQWHQLVAPN